MGMYGEQGLMNINPDRAMLDPVIVPNVPYYKAQLQVQAEVDQLKPPPRPANWAVSLPVPACLISEFEVYECSVYIWESNNLQTYASGVNNASACKDFGFTSTAAYQPCKPLGVELWF